MIGVVGISHKTASAEAREPYVLSPEEAQQLADALLLAKLFEGVVVLSTCNRTEIYYQLARSCKMSKHVFVLKTLAAIKQQNYETTKRLFYLHTNEACVLHLMRVAAGVDSLVVGEDQIIGQIKEAYRLSVDRGHTGAVFNRLFHKTFEAGKKVRNLTAINQGITSVSSAAVEMAQRELGSLESLKVLLVGAGETGELVVQNLRMKGCKHIFIANRTAQRAQMLAQKHGAQTILFDEFTARLHEFDIALFSTAAETPLISQDDVATAVKQRRQPLFLFDLSMPRNIDPEVSSSNRVRLFTIDDLVSVVSAYSERRKGEVEKAELIIRETATEFLDWMSTLALSPTITLLNQKFDSVVERRLTFLKNRVPADEYEIVERSSNYLKDKYVRLIVNNLRHLSDNGRKPEYIDMVNQLLELTKLER